MKDPKYQFTKVEDFPHILDERDFNQNTELYLTATALYKMGFMTKDEIKGSLDLFEQHRAQTKTKGIKIADPFYLKQLITGMRAMNKVMSPWFIRDWCLKCFKHLKVTSIMVFNNSLAIGRSPSKVKLQARNILETVELEAHEFLCLMANAFNRQQLIQELHDPNFKLEKQYIRHSQDKDDEPSFYIYKMDASKENFVGKV